MSIISTRTSMGAMVHHSNVYGNFLYRYGPVCIFCFGRDDRVGEWTTATANAMVMTTRKAKTKRGVPSTVPAEGHGFSRAEESRRKAATALSEAGAKSVGRNDCRCFSPGITNKFNKRLHAYRESRARRLPKPRTEPGDRLHPLSPPSLTTFLSKTAQKSRVKSLSHLTTSNQSK
jgi:hypothetical protein